MGKGRENVRVQDVTARLRQELPRLRKEYAIRMLGVFGSYVRGEQGERSDLDILVEFRKVPGMFRFLELERELSSMLGVRVDLVQKEALKPAIGRRIMQEIQVI